MFLTVLGIVAGFAAVIGFGAVVVWALDRASRLPPFSV